VTDHVQQAARLFGGAVTLVPGGVKLADASALKSPATDRLVRQAVFGGDAEREAARWLLWELGQITGARPASTGWFAEGGLGAVAFLPKASSDAAIGPALELRVGRGLFSWLGVGLHLAASSHEATVPPPPVTFVASAQANRSAVPAPISLRLPTNQNARSAFGPPAVSRRVYSNV